MKVTHIHFTALILVLCCLISSCEEKSNPNSPINFTVYGTVYNNIGEPVNGVEITLSYGGGNSSGAAGSAVSGLDGQFRIPCVTTHNMQLSNQHHYRIEAICVGYYDYHKSITIMEVEGAEIQMDISLKSVPSIIWPSY